MFFSYRPSVSRFPNRVCTSYEIFYDFLHLPYSSRSCPSPPVPRLWCSAWCDGLAGASGLAAVAVAAGYSLALPPPSCFRAHLYYLTSMVLGLSLPSTPSFPFSSPFSSPFSLPFPPSSPSLCPFLPSSSFPSPFPHSRPWGLDRPSIHIVGQAPGLVSEAAGYLPVGAITTYRLY